jgi:hypothetical protein
MRTLFILVVLFCTTFVSAQEIIGQFENSLKTSSSNVKDVFPIVNQETGDVAMFIADAKNVYGYQLNDAFEVVGKLSSQEKLRKYKLLLGSSINANRDHLVYLSNNSKKKFLCVTFSFETQTTSLKEFTFEDKNERLVQTINDNNQFYILTYHNPRSSSYDSYSGYRSNANTGSVYIYTFDQSGEMKRSKLDFGDARFADFSNRKVRFSNMILATSDKPDLKKFVENDPQSIESVAVPRKMYVRDGTVIFTFDQNREYTQMVTLELSTLNITTTRYEKPLIETPSLKKKSNSYLNGDYLFLSATTKEIYKLKIINYKTNQTLQIYKIEKEKPIDFKNSPIIQEGGTYANYRELEKTKKFLRKIYQGQIGISVLRRNNEFEVTLGGFVQKNTGGMMVPGFGIPIASTGNVTLFFNPTALAYNSYAATKSTRIECLFDENFNHIQGEISANAFDRMDEDPASSNGAAESVFRYRDFYLKGQYDSRNKLYSFRKFTN